MDELFDDPGDLGFFADDDEAIEPEELDNEFYSPAPGEDEFTNTKLIAVIRHSALELPENR
jgi:hypothetical protein